MTTYTAKPAKYLFVQFTGDASLFKANLSAALSAANLFYFCTYYELVGGGAVMVMPAGSEPVVVSQDQWLGLNIRDSSRGFVLVDDASFLEQFEQVS